MYTYDPAKAAQVLDAAGYKLVNGVLVDHTGKPIVLRLFADAASNEEQTEAKFITTELQGLGLRIKLEILDSGAMSDRIWSYSGNTYTPDFDLYVWDWDGYFDPGRPSPASSPPRSAAGTSPAGRTGNTISSVPSRRPRSTRRSASSSSGACSRSCTSRAPRSCSTIPTTCRPTTRQVDGLDADPERHRPGLLREREHHVSQSEADVGQDRRPLTHLAGRHRGLPGRAPRLHRGVEARTATPQKARGGVDVRGMPATRKPIVVSSPRGGDADARPGPDAYRWRQGSDSALTARRTRLQRPELRPLLDTNASGPKAACRRTHARLVTRSERHMLLTDPLKGR